MDGKIKKILKKIITFFYFIFTRILPVDKHMIVFESSLGRNFTGSPKAVFEEFIKRPEAENYRIYYIFDKPGECQGRLYMDTRGRKLKVHAVKNYRLKYYYILASAGVIITDTRFQKLFKRKGCLLIQTWHGTPLKKLALDMKNVNMSVSKDIEKYHAEFINESKSWDYLVVQNEFSEKVLPKAFGYRGALLRTGYPRNDILVNSMMQSCGGNIGSVKEISYYKTKFGLPCDKKVILYAPTWRDNAFYDNASYKFETKMDIGLMEKELGDKFTLAVKYHYLVNDNLAQKAGTFVHVFDAQTDISELYLAADMLITDYSSVMFDYSILKRPMFFYVFDLADYRDRVRGFYFDIGEEAPGPVVDRTDGLIKAIKNYDYNSYKDKYESFCRKYHGYETGNASKNIVDIIIK